MPDMEAFDIGSTLVGWDAGPRMILKIMLPVEG